MCNNKWNDIESKVKDTKNLCDLFILWRKAHIVEEEDSYEKTVPKDKKNKDKDNKYKKPKDLNKFKESFCKDGFLIDSHNKRADILFVLKESVTIDKKTGTEGEYRDTFWLKCYIKQGCPERDATAKKYLSWVKRKCKLNGVDRLDNIAYINLNKRGGFGLTHHPSLNKYVEKYKKFIKKQIEIINPKIIICGATKGYVSNVLEDSEYLNTVKIIDSYHPSCNREKR